MAYVDDAVFIPGQGAVLIAPKDTDCPELTVITKWLEDTTKNAGTFTPVGYTALDSLPGIISDITGGEVKGVWENPALRKTKTESKDSVVVKYAQWTKEPLQHRFGRDGTVDTTKKQFSIPANYIPVEVSLLIVFIDSSGPLVLHYRFASSSPDGSIETSNEDFMKMGVKYDILQITGKSKGTIMHKDMV